MAGFKYSKGLYRVEITAQRFGKSPKGSRYFEVDFDVQTFLDPVDKQEKPAEQNYNRSASIYLTEKAAKVSIPRLKALGVEGDFRDYEPSREGHKSLVGRRVLMWCRGQNDSGYDEWQVFYSDSGERERPKSDPSVASELDNIFSGALRSAKPQETAQDSPPVTVETSKEEVQLPF